MPKSSSTSSVEAQIFRNGSTTYYWSSRFFPKSVREDVFKLYSFVRVADDCIDVVPVNAAGFAEIRQLWQTQNYDGATNQLHVRVVRNIHDVAAKYDFDQEWIIAFLDAMQMDLDARRYDTIDDVLQYVYGSAEVIGLMMAKILGLPPESYEAARLQGRAMQWINFLRDIAEDIDLGRCYIPRTDLVKFDLPQLSAAQAKAKPEQYAALMAFELERYHQWQAQATTGFRHIPRRLLAPLKTAVDMYDWTATQIAANPQIVFDKKLKPKPWQVAAKGLTNIIDFNAKM